MSNHPTFTALRARLESEREKDANSGHYVEGESCPYYMDEIEAYKDGHEAATARLLSIVERAVEMAEQYGNPNNWEKYVLYFNEPKSEIERYDSDSVNPKGGKKAREFLTILADASGDK